MSFLLGYPKAIPYRAFTKFEHFGIIRFFLSYAPDISVKNALIDPVTVTFDLSTPKPYPKVIPYPIQSLNTLGSFVFELCCG